MAEINIDPEEVAHATNAMLVGEPYQGVRYASLQLSGKNIAKPADRYGEGVLLPRLVTTYWPGGAQGVTPESVYVTDLTDAAYEDSDTATVNEDYRRAHEVQRQIFGTGIADTTLVGARYPKGTEARIAVDYNALGISYGQFVPLGGIVVSRVVQHNQLKAGGFAASVYFPERTTYPAFILRAMKLALPDNYRD
jgi:hypothetical protein